jgi:hypothetical protein
MGQSESSDGDWLDDFRGLQLQMARAGSRDKPYDEPGNYRGYWLNTGVGASVKISSHWAGFVSFYGDPPVLKKISSFDQKLPFQVLMNVFPKTL